MRRRTALSLLLAGALVVAGCSNNGTTSNDNTGEPQPGGEVTVLLDAAFSGSWPTGLDPATNTTGGGNLTQMLAIYGGLFRLVADPDGSNARVEPHQAESYRFEDDDRTVRIKIRSGIKFTDGTDFDAEAVVYNIRRALTADCSCRPTWQLASDSIEENVYAEGDEVVITFAEPNATAVSAFVVSNVNWIGSPTAIEEMGEDEFRITPVAAGPFTVVSNELSSELVLEKNPDYFVEGRPYLDRLIVRSVGGDQPAYQALLAGQGDVYEGMTNIPVLDQARANDQLVVTQQPATSPYVIQLNTKAPPFNDKRAREAIYYATDVEAIRQGLFKGLYPAAQTFTAPGGLFHHDTVPGYLTYDPDRARQLVEEIEAETGQPFTVDLGTLDAYVANQVNIELERQWEEVGIETTIHSEQLAGLVQNFVGGQWQAMLQTAGAWDPAIGVGVAFRFASTFPFSGVADERVDELLARGMQTTDPDERDAIYLELGTYIAEQAYAPYILAFAPATVARRNVHGPGVDTLIPPAVVNTAILWDEVWTTQT